MKLKISDIVNKHKGTPCVVALHGPSLNEHKEQISSLQEEKKILRFSVSEWYDFFDTKPDYWIVSNSEFNIQSSLLGDPLWEERGYPFNVFNKYDVPLFYNKSVDFTDPEFVEKNLEHDYLPYDYKHFKGHSCRDILLNFKKYYEKNKNLNFKYYGNNSHMWQKPDVKNVNPYCAKVHNKIGGAYSLNGKCCRHIDSLTIQEELQIISDCDQHLGPVATVGFVGIMFSIIMGCNPIYVSGLDLDYELGYANGGEKYHKFISIGNVGHWKHSYRESILSDMKILKESAENLGIKIINLNKNSWHDVFEKGEFLH